MNTRCAWARPAELPALRAREAVPPVKAREYGQEETFFSCARKNFSRIFVPWSPITFTKPKEVLMNKADLIATVAADCRMPKIVAEKAVNSILDNIKKGTRKGGVQLIGFGSFSVGKRQARKGRNPQTGKEIVIPSSKVVRFRAAAAYKQII
jgi:DNA-binding protein HU-beta